MQVAHKNLKQVIDYVNFKAQITWQYNKSLNKFHHLCCVTNIINSFDALCAFKQYDKYCSFVIIKNSIGDSLLVKLSASNDYPLSC